MAPWIPKGIEGCLREATKKVPPLMARPLRPHPLDLSLVARLYRRPPLSSGLATSRETFFAASLTKLQEKLDYFIRLLFSMLLVCMVYV